MEEVAEDVAVDAAVAVDAELFPARWPGLVTCRFASSAHWVAVSVATHFVRTVMHSQPRIILQGMMSSQML